MTAFIVWLGDYLRHMLPFVYGLLWGRYAVPKCRKAHGSRQVPFELITRDDKKGTR